MGEWKTIRKAGSSAAVTRQPVAAANGHSTIAATETGGDRLERLATRANGTFDSDLWQSYLKEVKS